MSDNGTYTASPEIVEDDTSNTSTEIAEDEEVAVPNRLKDFYYNEAKCEFRDCSGTAIHHCADGTLYWEGCGRVFCKDHAISTKENDDGFDELAFLCAECYSRFKAEAFTWKCYSLCSIFTALLTIVLIWILTTSTYDFQSLLSYSQS